MCLQSCKAMRMMLLNLLKRKRSIMSMAAWPIKIPEVSRQGLRCVRASKAWVMKSRDAIRKFPSEEAWHAFVDIWPISTHINIISVLQLHLDLNYYLVESDAKSKHACFSIMSSNFKALSLVFRAASFHLHLGGTSVENGRDRSRWDGRHVNLGDQTFKWHAQPGSRKTHTDRRFLWIDKTCQLCELSFYDLQIHFS